MDNVTKFIDDLEKNGEAIFLKEEWQLGKYNIIDVKALDDGKLEIKEYINESVGNPLFVEESLKEVIVDEDKESELVNLICKIADSNLTDIHGVILTRKNSNIVDEKLLKVLKNIAIRVLSISNHLLVNNICTPDSSSEMYFKEAYNESFKEKPDNDDYSIEEIKEVEDFLIERHRYINELGKKLQDKNLDAEERIKDSYKWIDLINDRKAYINEKEKEKILTRS